MNNNNLHRWRFFRAGGFDQVRLDSAADLRALDGLDQKLWVALSCPVQGIEFDARTLSFVDSDGDGHVRAPELIGAVRWAAARLNDAGLLAQGLDGVPLAAIRDDDEGASIAAAARALLAENGTAGDFARSRDCPPTPSARCPIPMPRSGSRGSSTWASSPPSSCCCSPASCA